VKKFDKASFWTILLTVFIDMLGVGIIIPVIPSIFFGADSGFFGPEVTEASKSIWYGVLLACFPAMQFIGSPLLGALSDRHGRKPILSISLVGVCFGYLLFGLAIEMQHLGLLFFSRLLPGFSSGNIAIMYSSISDISKPEEKAKNFGMIGAAFGLGFILGPAIGGYLADSEVVSWFNHATPFYFTAIITFINILLVKFRFPETLKEKRNTPISPFTGFKNLKKSLGDPNLRTIFSVVLLISLGFTFFTQFFAVVLLEGFDFTIKDLGLFYGWIGIWLVFTQGFLVGKISMRFSSEQVLKITILTLAIGIGINVIFENYMWFYVFAAVIAISYGLTSPNLTTLVSEKVGADRQGEILGINQSMNSFGQIAPPIVGGFLNILDGTYPIIAAGVIIAMGWLVFVIWKK
jgi:DHA1 family tetracycline resistance protein-like MFS transporter